MSFISKSPSEIFTVVVDILFAFSIVIFSIPKVVKVAKCKKLYDYIDERKVHSGNIPPLGGVSLFASFVLSVILFSKESGCLYTSEIIAASLLLFYIGLKDDLITIPARKKLIVQVVAAIYLSVGNIQITNLHGLLGIEELPLWLRMPVTVFCIIAFINSFNLIDGVDGLASGIGILSTFFFGGIFYLSGYLELAVISFALFGGLTGFFIYNVFGKSNKIFLGDSGAMIVGLIVCILFIECNNIVDTNSKYLFLSSPVIPLVVILIPMFDTLRVMVIRICHGKSPFLPDKNHIHHRLLLLVKNHLYVTIIILFANILLIYLAIMFSYYIKNVTIQLAYILIICALLFFIPSFSNHTSKTKILKKAYLD